MEIYICIFFFCDFLPNLWSQGTPVEEGCLRVTVLIITNCCSDRRLLLESRQVQRTDNHLRSLLLAPSIFPANNLQAFHKYSEFHAVNTRHKRDLHEPVANVTFTKREYSMLEQNFIPILHKKFIHKNYYQTIELLE